MTRNVEVLCSSCLCCVGWFFRVRVVSCRVLSCSFVLCRFVCFVLFRVRVLTCFLCVVAFMSFIVSSRVVLVCVVIFFMWSPPPASLFTCSVVFGGCLCCVSFARFAILATFPSCVDVSCVFHRSVVFCVVCAVFHAFRRSTVPLSCVWWFSVVVFMSFIAPSCFVLVRVVFVTALRVSARDDVHHSVVFCGGVFCVCACSRVSVPQCSAAFGCVWVVYVSCLLSVPSCGLRCVLCSSPHFVPTYVVVVSCCTLHAVHHSVCRFVR